MNVVIYARYSSHNQHETSIEGQLKVCYDYCKRNKYTVIAEYIDRAISGTTDSRPQFQKMIEDAASRQFQYVIVYQLDRFSRNRYDSAIYKSKLKKHNVRVLSAKENITEDASGILMESVLEGMAEYYSAELAQKIRRGMDINAEKCLCTGGNVALGYKIDSEKRFHIDPETAPIVQMIFEMYTSGKSSKEIIDYLNSCGYKTSRGAAFNKSSLSRLLQNKRYIGIYTYRGKETPGGIPRIVSDELFYKAAKILEKTKRAPATAKANVEYLLTTKLFCGHCKEMMTGYSGTSKTGKKHHYYLCKGKIKRVCGKKNIRKDLIEDIVIDACRQLLTESNISKIANEIMSANKKSEENSTLTYLEKQLKDVERKQTNLMNAIIECDIDVARKALYAEIPKLEDAKKTLEEEIRKERIGHIPITKQQIRFFLKSLKNGDVNDIKYRKSLIATFVNSVYLYDDKLTIIFNTGQSSVSVDIDYITYVSGKDEGSKSSYLDASPPPTGPYTNPVFLDTMQILYFKNYFAVTVQI